MSNCLVAASRTSFELTICAFKSVHLVTSSTILADHHSCRYWLLQSLFRRSSSYILLWHARMSLCRPGPLMELQGGPARSEASQIAGKRNFQWTAREAIRKLRMLYFQKPKNAQHQYEGTMPEVRINSSNIRLTTVQTIKPSFASAIFRWSSNYRF